MAGLWGTLALLTRIPIPANLTEIGHRHGAAVAWFPLVGAVLGGILVAADLLLGWLQAATLVRATVVVVLLVLLTGALHLDGLMDTCDAAFVHATPERRLEIMRDPHVGAFGATGLAAVLLLKVAALEALPGTSAMRAEAVLLAPILGRWGIAIAAATFPYGRPGGLGEQVKASATSRGLGIASILPVSLALALLPTGLGLLLLAALAAWLLGRWLSTLLPGLTGDSYGALCELVETLVLLAFAPLHAALSRA
jgi:adenosylcobinamide-GDP ribazoletransferase